MMNVDPSFYVNVDLTNPGQFFACCGLLEMAHRIWPGAEGWFNDHRFSIALQKQANGTLRHLIDQLSRSIWLENKRRGCKSIYPIYCDFFSLELDWWLRPDWYRFKDKPMDKRIKLMSSQLKLWAGNQSSSQITSDLIRAILTRSRIIQPEDLLNSLVPLKGRFGIDYRSAWNSLDIGFSPNAQQMSVNTYPAVEMLGAIGLQRFRPISENNGNLVYVTWHAPLSICVASALGSASISPSIIKKWRFSIDSRGSFKGFSMALPNGD
ncbi:MAG: hypothetical protein ABFD97_00725 [Syntrophobacter sp.]